MKCQNQTQNPFPEKNLCLTNWYFLKWVEYVYLEDGMSLVPSPKHQALINNVDKY